MRLSEVLEQQQAPEFVMIRAVLRDEEDTDTALWTTADLEEGSSEMCVSLKVKVDTPFARIASVLAERLRLELPTVQVRNPREIYSQSEREIASAELRFLRD